MAFYEKDRQILPSYHNRPFNVTTFTHDVELTRALIDPGYSLNLMPLSALDTVGIHLEQIVEQPIEVSGFEGSTSFTLGYININFTVLPIRIATNFC